MMPDIPLLVLGLFSDVGWIVHLIAGIIYFCRNGFHHVLDYIALIALAGVVVGGLLNFAFGLPIYLSFKKGIFYGVKSLLIYQSFGSAADANYYLNDYKLIINMMLLIKHIISGNLKLCAFLFYE